MMLSSLPARKRATWRWWVASALVLCALVFGAVRYREHADRIAAMNRKVAALDARLSRDRDVQRTLDAALDPYNHSINQFDNEVAAAGFSEMAVFDEKLAAIDHSVQRIDRLIARLQHLNPENTTQRDSVSAFETYWRGSDDFHDRILAARGMAKAAQANPFSVLAMAGSDEGTRFRKAQGRYVHGLQDIINSLSSGVDELAASAQAQKRRLSGTRSESVVAWLRAQ